MKKTKTFWQCGKCDHVSPKWSGQCPHCGAWNSLQEQVEQYFPAGLNAKKIAGKAQTTASLKLFNHTQKTRISSGFDEADRVLGGGFLGDAIILLIGNPGIGKSTLSLQIALNIAKKGKKTLIASGEESVSQIAERGKRISGKNVNLDNIDILNEYLVENLLATAELQKPDFLLVDSAQTFASGTLANTAGSITQIRAVTEKLMQFTKTNNIPCLLIGHVTKGGEMAGPQSLAHLVDAVLVIEGDEHHQFRILKSTKNRFGSVFEAGVFEMTARGLTEVKNPSEAFLSGRLANAIGSVVFPAIEGTRSFLVEMQALCAITRFGLPKRTTSGFALSRLSLLLAVLENYAKINFQSRDVFVNIIGGFKVSEPAADLPLALALASAAKKKSLSEGFFACGEIGLSGEIRAVSHLEKRLQEGKKLGFDKAIIPKVKNAPIIKGLELIAVKTVSEAVNLMLI